MSTTPIRTTKHVFALDCPDPATLADFYARLLGLRTHSADEHPDWVDVVPSEGVSPRLALGYQRVPHYRAPEWPAARQMSSTIRAASPSPPNSWIQG